MRKMMIHYKGIPIYPIILSENFDGLGAAFEKLSVKDRKVCIVTDSHVAEHYLAQVEAIAAAHCASAVHFIFPAGEESKTLATVENLYEFLIQNKFERRDMLAALGGGVVGDLTGFTAATYLRGIDFIQIPTTLLAAVDSSVGGKTGVNISAGKNLMGSFWQPSLVLYDTGTFESLNDDLILDGTAEIIKTAAIRDASLLQLVEKSGIESCLPDITARCVKIKVGIVEKDEKESALRKILNFGHTMAHAIEKDSEYRISHGKAVAIGMLMVTQASEAAGMTEKGTYRKLFDLIASKGFETSYPGADLKRLCQLATNDKKASGDSVSLVYIEKIGISSICDVKLDQMQSFFEGEGQIYLKR